jgi:hypothetical protein
VIARILFPALLFLASLSYGLWQQGRADRATARADAAESLSQGYQEAAAMRAKQDAAQAILRADAAVLDRDLESMEGADAPLSDYLGTAAGRLWGG